jgi:hypothetical protein
MPVSRTWVAPGQRSAAEPGDRTPDHPKPLSGRWVDLLRDGNQGDYATNHAAVMAVAVAAVRAGWSFADFDAELSNPWNKLAQQHRIKDDGRQRTGSHAATKLRRDWDKAVLFARQNPTVSDRTEALQQVGLIRAAARAADWTGRSGPRDMAVLGILLDAASAHSTLTPTLSLREICERSPYRGFKTCGRAIEALALAGWITVDRREAAADQPNSYRLHAPGKGGSKRHNTTVCAGGTDDVSVWPPPTGHSRERYSTDLALVFGTHAAIVHATLDPDIPQTRPQVVQRSGVSESTAKRWLRNLSRAGLARQTPKGWLQGLTDPQLVAADYGAFDVVLDREARHAKDRESFCAYRAAEQVDLVDTTTGEITHPVAGRRKRRPGGARTGKAGRSDRGRRTTPRESVSAGPLPVMATDEVPPPRHAGGAHAGGQPDGRGGIVTETCERGKHDDQLA